MRFSWGTATAGFRVQDNLVHGRFVYVDALVIDASCRSRGYGKILIERLKAEAKLLNCARLLLDAGKMVIWVTCCGRLRGHTGIGWNGCSPTCV